MQLVEDICTDPSPALPTRGVALSPLTAPRHARRAMASTRKIAVEDHRASPAVTRALHIATNATLKDLRDAVSKVASSMGYCASASH